MLELIKKLFKQDGVAVIQKAIGAFKKIQDDLEKGINLAMDKALKIEEEIAVKQSEAAAIHQEIHKAGAVLKNLSKLLGE